MLPFLLLYGRMKIPVYPALSVIEFSASFASGIS